MPGPVPVALRQRVVDAWHRGEGNYKELAARFQVGAASVNRWLALQRSKGSVVPHRVGGNRRPLLIGREGEEYLPKVLEAQNDSTLDGQYSAYEEEFVAMVSNQ